MKMSWIVCKNCYARVPDPWASQLPTDDETLFDQLLAQVRHRRVPCPYCGGHKWIRKVASKL